VDVPVTLKIRTGWAAANRNAPQIARIAEASGIAALAVHGRTRDQQYTGIAEYDTIAAIKSLLAIPVIANGDIDSPEKARAVLRHRLRRGDDRPRRAGPAVDLSARSRTTWPPANAAAPRCTRSATSCSGTCRHCTRSTANTRACASRASTWAGMRRTGRRTPRSAPWSIAHLPVAA
jgi:hypothetical protein